ncbi:insulin-like growth factor binding protein [Anaeramoeba flamelloides]|uniref:Insulin-like growth factor binding protein n=1 Tax=Anaeramoeba flamelloides TaxID=1746091 RepID=A0ABQ8YYU3_9EUKA|nr:insulin-like growth factor binding protein [Anaeramoeba flamelloides]
MENCEGNKFPPEQIGIEFQVNTMNNSFQGVSSVASICANNERFVIVWQSYNQVKQDSLDDIFAQIYNSSNGERIGFEFQVNTYTTSAQKSPSVASIGANNERFVIAWISKYSDAGGESDYDLSAQIYNSSNGEPIGTEFQVNTLTISGEKRPSVASIGADNERFVITWQGNLTDTGGGSVLGIFAQVFTSSNGNPIGTEFQANNLTIPGEKSPSVAATGANNERFVITWQGKYTDSGEDILDGIFARVYTSSDLAPIDEEEFQVNNMTVSGENSPSVASIGANKERFVITWQGKSTDNGEDILDGIFARAYTSSDLKPIGKEDFQVNTDRPYDRQNIPSVTSIGANRERFVITWHSRHMGNASDWRILAQPYDSLNLYPVGPEFQVNTNTGSERQFPTVASIGTNGERFVITWQGYTKNILWFDVYAQMYESAQVCNCNQGSYSNYTENPNYCYKCREGTYQDATGSTACSSCLKGMFQDKEGSRVCKECPLGTYQPLTGQPECIGCPIGTYQDQNGQSNDCKNCPSGTYQNTTGQSICLECEAGQYSNAGGKSTCQPCEIGTYQDSTGSTACSSCLKGMFQDKEGSRVMQKVPIGDLSK